MHPLIALITLLTVLLLITTAVMVGRARGRLGVPAPATSGHPLFDRVFRVQGNTQEAALMFLPALWTAALFGHALISSALGGIWLLARAWFVVAYADPGKSRAFPFTLGLVANTLLLLQGLWGIAAVYFVA